VLTWRNYSFTAGSRGRERQSFDLHFYKKNHQFSAAEAEKEWQTSN